MKVVNQTKKTIIAENVVAPTSLLDQSLGLLKYKTPQAMLLKTHFGIHTFGMRYPIDVVILDKQNRVALVKINLKPNNIFIWDITQETVLELPQGTIEKTKTKLEDQLTFST
jgi:uncharacterized protein